MRKTRKLEMKLQEHKDFLTKLIEKCDLSDKATKAIDEVLQQME